MISRENREHMRIPFEGPVTFTPAGTSGKYTGTCLNLSHTGIQFETDAGLNPGQMVQGTLKTGFSQLAPMEITFVVIRIEKGSALSFRVSGQMIRIDGRDIPLR